MTTSPNDLIGLLDGDGSPGWQQRVHEFVEQVQGRRRAVCDQVLADLPEYQLREVNWPTELQKMLIRQDGRKIYAVVIGRGGDARNYGTLHALPDGKWAAGNYGSSVLLPARINEREAVADALTEYLISRG